MSTPEHSVSPPAPEALILAVGHADADRVALEALLAALGVRVLAAADSREALELLQRHAIALVVVDAEMPEANGLEVAKAIRGASRDHAPPVLLVGVSAPEREPLARGSEGGGVEFLAKPVDPELLRGKAALLIELSRQRRLLSARDADLHGLHRMCELLTGALGHDLRSPLNAISLASETLLLARPDDEMAALIGGRIRSATQRMSRQISQILDFVAMRSQPWTPRARDVDLGELCRTAASEFDELAKGGFDCGVEGDPRGSWDPDRLLQMLSNLIGHGVHHGPAGETIAVRIDGRSPDEVTIALEGGGELSEAARARLFDPFAAPGDKRGGANIGLYLVDQIARAHGGSAAAEPGGGRTRFTVRLPRRTGAS